MSKAVRYRYSMPSIQSAESSQVTRTRSCASWRSGSNTAKRRNSSKLTWWFAAQVNHLASRSTSNGLGTGWCNDHSHLVVISSSQVASGCQQHMEDTVRTPQVVKPAQA